MYKRRSDCGREGGTEKNPNHFQEYDPAYTIFFGTKLAPRFTRVPGNSEVDRSVAIYLPNRFCDDADLRREPLSRRRFRKLDIEKEAGAPEITWAILDILLRVRRGRRI